MITSMTGYAEKRSDSDVFSVRITIKTLNHRYFDWNYHGDRIGDIENQLRQICKESIHRGRVDVFLDIEFLDSSMFDLRFNKNLLKKVSDSIKDIDEEIRKSMNIRVKDLFSIPHLIEMKYRDFTEKEVEFLKKAFRNTVDQLQKEREREGRRLLKGVKRHLSEIQFCVKKIENRAEKQPALIQKKLMDRIKSLSCDVEISEERIAEETALYAQKYDLNEEIERLKSHLLHFEALFSEKNKDPIGKKLDFASQEILRETNTIGSKSQDIETSKNCLVIKSELESIRQQIRNLE
ncbi:MAG: YicC family protein [Candidatus Aminicenantes bacterium]|nr:YicC family protein [Candidatus Aminicenantes bacterium]